MVAGAVQALALPFVLLARREGAHSDPINVVPADEAPA
jgi:hypothetical protein